MMNEEDKRNYMFDKYVDRYNMPFFDFLRFLRKDGMTDNSVYKSVDTVLDDAYSKGIKKEQVLFFIDSFATDKKMLGYNNPAIEMRRLIDLKVKKFLQDNSKYKLAYVGNNLTEHYFLVACHMLQDIFIINTVVTSPSVAKEVRSEKPSLCKFG